METFAWMFKLYDGMSGPAKAITGSLGRIEEGLKDMPKHTAMAEEGLRRLVDAGMELGKLVLEGAKFGVESLAFKESTLASFKLMLGTKQEAEEFFNKAKNFALFTPFETESVIKSFQKLKGAGFSKEAVPVLFQAIGDVTAASGMDQNVMDRLTYAFGQIRNGGAHMLGHALREVFINGSQAGLSQELVYQNMAKALGVDPATAQEMVHKGKVTAGVAMGAVLDTIKQTASGGKELGQGMLDQAFTLRGLWSSLKSRPMELFLDMDLDRLDGFKGLKTFLQNLVDIINPLTASGQRMKGVFEGILNDVGGWLGAFSVDDIVSGFDMLVEGSKIAMQGVRLFGRSLMAVIGPTLYLFGEMEGGKGKTQAFYEVMTGLGKVVGYIANGFLIMGAVIVKAMEGIGQAGDIDWGFALNELDKLRPNILGLLESLRSSLVSAMVNIGLDVARGFAQAITGQGTDIAMKAISSLGAASVMALKVMLGIHSPSTVFAELGEFTSEGFAQGVSGASGKVDQAVTSMVTIPQGRGGRGGAGSPTVNLTVNVSGAGSDGESIARKLAELLPASLASAFEQLALEDGVA